MRSQAYGGGQTQAKLQTGGGLATTVDVRLAYGQSMGGANRGARNCDANGLCGNSRYARVPVRWTVKPLSAFEFK